MPLSPTTLGEATFTFTSGEAGLSFRCALDGGSFTPCTSPASYTGLPVGARTFAVKALRDADSTESAPASATWTIAAPPAPPPDPATTAPPLETGESVSLFAATSFLYSGPGAVQTGVAPGTIEFARVAVLRGRVLDADGDALSSVEITALDHPELGKTVTRADGRFDLAVNGGGLVTLVYERTGFMPLQREVHAPWQDYAIIEDVVMNTYDVQVTSIEPDAGAYQVAQGSEVTDGDGIRQATLLFRPGTEAEMTLSSGARAVLDEPLRIRATEYTVGDDGEESMPGELPATSAFTYAVELSVDQAVAAGATDVQFDQPVVNYVDNFLDFPAGTAVPTGFYDREQGDWVASDDGVVIDVLSVAGEIAAVDGDGDGDADTPAELAAIGMDEGERRALATLYGAGTSLWRVEITHFTPWDHNWPYGLPAGARGPDQPSGALPPGEQGRGCQQPGSIVSCLTQSLGESLPVFGTQYTLNYDSSRMPGRVDSNKLTVRLTGPSPPASLDRVEVTMSVAGQTFHRTVPAAPNESTTFVWDGNDAFGRPVEGAQTATVKIDYVYPAVYLDAPEFARSFADYGGAPISTDRTRLEISLSQEWSTSLGGRVDPRTVGLGGWTLDVHHSYDPASRTLYLGDGTEQTGDALRVELSTYAGDGEDRHFGDGGPAADASFSVIRGLAAAADGSLYVADTGNDVVRRIGPDGIVSTFAGGGDPADGLGDGGPATQAALVGPWDVAVGLDGSVYISDTGNNRVRRVDAGGTISTVAGGGIPASGLGDGGPATSAALQRPRGLAVGMDGALFVTDSGHDRVRRVGPDGTISTAVGGGTPADGVGDGEPAADAALDLPSDVAVADDGTLFVADTAHNRVRRITPDGRIGTHAGNGLDGNGGDGGPAVDAELAPEAIALAADGTLVVADRLRHRLRSVSAEGEIRALAGSGQSGFDGDGGPPLAAQLARPSAVTASPGGTLYLADTGNFRVRRLDVPLPGFSVLNSLLPSEDGTQLYEFSDTGRHLRTSSTLTGQTLVEFGYDAQNRLSTVTDADGNVTSIDRGAGLAIVGPFGRRTELALDPAGFLERVADAAGHAVLMEYDAGGLLTQATDPRSHDHTFTYDASGRLIGEQDPAGGSKALTRTELLDGHRVIVESELGRTTAYTVERLPTGATRSITVDPAGGVTTALVAADGSSQSVAYPDGSSIQIAMGADPRFGMRAPLVEELSRRTPGGKTRTLTRSREVVLADPDDLLSLASQTDTTVIGGRTTTQHFNALTRTLTFTSPEGRLQTFAIDPQGRLKSAQLAPGVDPIVQTRDGFGRLTAVTQGDQSWTYTFDAFGRIASSTDAASRTTEYEYDAGDRLVEIEQPSGAVLRFAYDATGNRTRVEMPSTDAHLLDYTEIDLPMLYDPPGVGELRNHFDADRALDRTVLPSGATLDFAYDDGGRPTGVTSPDASTALGYVGATEHLASVARTPTGGLAQTLTATYDGWLATGQEFGGPASGDYAYEYNDLLELSRMELTRGTETLELALDRDDDALITDYGPFSFSRAPATGFVSSISDGTLESEYTYDSQGRVATRADEVLGTQVYRIALTYEPTGEVARKVETIGGATATYDYEYDADGQLVDVVRNPGTPSEETVEHYVYDENGNRTSRTVHGDPAEPATYDDQDRLVDRSGVAYDFDLDGFVAGRGSDTFDYSARGELLSATVGGSTVSYVYDGLGRRVRRTEGSETTEYLYGDPRNASRISAIREPSGDLTQLYYTPAETLFAFERGSTRYYVSADQTGTPKVVTRDDGTVVKTLEHDSFGNVLSDSDPGFELPLGLAGGLQDATTGLVRFGFRDYEPPAGRWTARDPVLYGGRQANLYSYVGNDPIGQRDPLGLWGGCIGGSAYEGLGAGGKICITEKGIGACVEAGGGIGGGFEIEPTNDLPESGTTAGIEVSGSVPGASGTLGCTISMCGEWDCGAGVAAGPVSAGCSYREGCSGPSFDITPETDDADGAGGGNKGGSSGPDKAGAGVGGKIEGKIYLEHCAQATWSAMGFK